MDPSDVTVPSNLTWLTHSLTLKQGNNQVVPLMVSSWCGQVTVGPLWSSVSQKGQSDDVYEAAREQSGPAVPLECSFEPAVLSLPVDKHYVSLLQFQLCLTLRGVGHHHSVPGEEK